MDTLDYEDSLREAFFRRRAELEAIPARDIMRLNLEPMGVVSVVLRADPRIRSLRSESPTFSSWRQGTGLDIGEWLTPKPPAHRTPAIIVSVTHLDDEERTLVLGMLLEELLAWVRGLSGSQRLRALVVFDEVYGFLPPHLANPPTKRPLVALMKPARAFGVGVVVVTQNPMDLDYRALSNSGLWCVGRLQTDADRARVIDGLSSAQDNGEPDAADLGRTVRRLDNRWFTVRNAHAARSGPILLQPRQTYSWLRGPMTRTELRRAIELRRGVEGADSEFATRGGGRAGSWMKAAILSTVRRRAGDPMMSGRAHVISYDSTKRNLCFSFVRQLGLACTKLNLSLRFVHA